MYKFEYTEEILQTRIAEGIEEKQKSHETLAHLKKEILKKIELVL